jgi:DNA-binding NarL/FixJ family response regulator
MLGGRSGADLVAQCLAAVPALSILVLSQHDEALHAERVLKAGARGYLMKGAELDGVVQALDALQRGEIVLSPRMNTRILARRLQGGPAERYADLSNREMQVFMLIGAGMTTGQIAEALNLSPKTVGAHREKIKTKLGLETASELEREALLYVERGQ